MNTIRRSRGSSSPIDQPHEHFRSTGIRDPVINPAAFNSGESKCLQFLSTWTLKENRCFANVWDCSSPVNSLGGCEPSIDELRPRFEGLLSETIGSNDMDESKRPMQGLTLIDSSGVTRTLTANCTDFDSGEERCPSQVCVHARACGCVCAMPLDDAERPNGTDLDAHARRSHALGYAS